jgi:hypothetical protein
MVSDWRGTNRLGDWLPSPVPLSDASFERLIDDGA